MTLFEAHWDGKRKNEQSSRTTGKRLVLSLMEFVGFLAYELLSLSQAAAPRLSA